MTTHDNWLSLFVVTAQGACKGLSQGFLIFELCHVSHGRNWFLFIGGKKIERRLNIDHAPVKCSASSLDTHDLKSLMFAAVQACHAEVDYDVWDDIPPGLLVLAWFCCWPHFCNRNCLCCCTPHATNCQYYVNCAVLFLTTPLSYQGTQIIPQVLPYRVWIHRFPQKR